MLHSIRSRLTLWLTVLIALCMGAFALYLYVAVDATLTGNLERTLRVQAQQVVSNFDFQGPELGNDGTGQHIDIGAVDQFATAGLFVEAFDARGQLVARSSNLGRLHLPDEARAAALLRMAPHLSTQSVPGGALRVYSLPAVRGGHTVGLVLAAASLREVTSATQTLLALLLGGGLAVLLLAALGSGMLVRRGLRPLDDMATVAESITARQLDRRLDLHNPPAEVGRLASTFDAMLDRLHEAFAAQRRFVADASHELRTPLAAVHGRSEVLLLDSAHTDDTREGLNMIRDETARMGRLVANLLLLARGDEAQTIDRRPVELDVLLLEVARQAHTLAQAHGVRVAIGHEDQALILGDADLLKQLLLNLVDNAVTYTPAGGRVELSLHVVGSTAQVAVRDTGPGIAPADRARIFERFYRLDLARSRRGGGAGLGLAIARWIAEVHEGHIAVDSVVGQGSTFRVVLPLCNRTLTLP